MADYHRFYKKSRFFENLLEHGFLHDLSRVYALNEPYRYLNVLRSEVDIFGIDLTLSLDGELRHVQLKTRSTAPPPNPYHIAESLWRMQGGCVVWILYNPEKLRPINYWILDCKKQPVKKFPLSKRDGYRLIKMRQAEEKGKSLKECAEILFKGRLHDLSHLDK